MPVLKKRRRAHLINLAVNEVSAVRKPANALALIKIIKSGAASVDLAVTETDADRRYVAGWAVVSTVNGEPYVDDQGDMVDEPTMRAAAKEFMTSFRRGGVEHGDDTDAISFHESIVLGEEAQQALGIDLGMTGWWLGGTVNDAETWKRIKSGEIAGLSIAGHGVRVSKAKGAQPARRGGAMTFSQALARTPSPAPGAVAKAISRAAAPTARKAAPVPVQRQAAPKAMAPAAPTPSTVALDACRRAIARATAPRGQTTEQAAAARVTTMNRDLLRIAAKVDGPSAARLALKRMTAGK